MLVLKVLTCKAMIDKHSKLQSIFKALNMDVKISGEGLLLEPLQYKNGLWTGQMQRKQKISPWYDQFVGFQILSARNFLQRKY